MKAAKRLTVAILAALVLFGTMGETASAAEQESGISILQTVYVIHVRF